MKKIVSIICVISMLLSLFVLPANAKELTLVKENIDCELSISATGFGREFIDYFTVNDKVYISSFSEDSTLIYDVEKNKTVKEISSKFYKINSYKMSKGTYIILGNSEKNILCDENWNIIQDSKSITVLNDKLVSLYTGNNTYKIFNIENAKTIDYEYDCLYYGSFSNDGGVARLKSDEKWYLIDENGNKTNQCISLASNQRFYDYIGHGLYIVADAHPDWAYMHSSSNLGIMNANFEYVIQPLYSGVLGQHDYDHRNSKFFFEGFALIGTDDFYSREYRYFDSNGTFLTDEAYSNASQFLGGIAVVRKGNEYGVINTKGETVIPFEYDSLTNFGDGYIAAKKDECWGVINSKNEVIITFEYEYVYDYEGNGIFYISKDDSDYYINEENNKVDFTPIETEYVYTCAGPVEGSKFEEVLTINATGETFDFTGTGLRVYLIGEKNEYVLAVDENKKWYKLSFVSQNKDFTNITFSNQTYSYDGTEKALKVTGTLPEEATVTYTNEKGTNVGTYNSKAVIEADGYNTLTLNATMTITPAPITVKAKDVTIKTGAIIPTFDENSYEITSGKLFGSDKITGTLATDCKSTLDAKDFNITQGTLTAGNNYNLTFVNGKLSVVDKTPQVITVADIDAKTYGDESFKLEVTPDETSKLDTFTYASSNSDVADIAADGTVTIKGAGETTITVSQAGNEEYALAEKSVKLVVNPITVTVSAIDMDNKTATIEGVLETDKSGVELDFDSVKTTVISSGKTTVEETTTITSTLKVTNFTFKGEKAKNYVADKTAFLTTTVVSTTVAEKLTEDENVTIEAAPVDDKTIIITDVAVAPEAEVKKVTIDVTAIADTKVNTVALPKTTVDAIIGIDPEATLEITLKDGSEENKESTITLNAQALAAIQTAGASATTISISVDKAEKEELATEQAAKVDEVSTKTPVVYSLSIVDEAGNSVAGSFGDAGKATVTLPYTKPSGNGNVIVKYLDDLGNLTNISNPKYDASTQTVTVELGHFSEYLIYTEPVVSYGGGGGGVSRYTVKFETNGGSTVKSVTVNKNAVAAEPTAPTKDGFKFEGWYTDKELTIAYDFTAKVTKSFTLYAKWAEIEKEPEVVEPDTSISFKDVKANDWFYANVQYVVENKLMNGVAEDKFAPNDTLTRAMLVTVLYRIEGEPVVNKSIPFVDVDMDAWYANAVSWAKQNGIVNGVNETDFAPDNNITREQIATIIYRYAIYKDMDAVTMGENLHFSDANEISEYAVSAMNWAVGTGLMKGKSATTINPKDNATRAEIAAILQRFIEANK